MAGASVVCAGIDCEGPLFISDEIILAKDAVPGASVPNGVNGGGSF